MSAPTRGTRDARRRVSGSPWQGIIDASENAARRFSDPVAMEGMNAAQTAAGAVEALAKAFMAVGKTTVDTVAIDPRVAAFMEGLGQYVMKAVQPTQEAGDAITRAHEEKMNRVTENDPRERKWDIAAHDGRDFSGGRRFGRRTG